MIMDISIQQPVGKLEGIWISGLTKDQKKEIRQFIDSRIRFLDHSNAQTVKNAGPFFQIDHDDILFIECWTMNKQNVIDLYQLLRESFKDWIL